VYLFPALLYLNIASGDCEEDLVDDGHVGCCAV
jgi:hypothetical protein